MSQIRSVYKRREWYWRLFPFKTDTVVGQLADDPRPLKTSNKAYILIFTGMFTASELANEKGSMIHFLQK